MSELARKSSCALALLAFILAIGASIVAGYTCYLGMQYKHTIDIQMPVLIRQNIELRQANEDIDKRLQSNLNELNSKLDKINGSKNKLLIFQISELVGLANQNLLVYNDIADALRILNYAQKMLAQSSDPLFNSLKYAINSDSSKLYGLANVDKVELSAKLDSLTTQILSLHINDLTGVEKSSSMLPKTDGNTKWHIFLSNIKNSLLGIVTVNKAAQSTVLLPTDETIIKDALRIELLNAKLALLQHDQNSWAQSLNRAKSIVTDNLANYQGADKISQQLDSLLTVNVSNNGVNLDKTTLELMKLEDL